MKSLVCTVQEYHECLKAWGLVRVKGTYDGSSIYKSRDGEICNIADPEGLTAEERSAMLELVKFRMGINNH